LFGYSKQAYYQHQQGCLRRQSARNTALALTQQVRYRLPRLGTRKLHYLLREEFVRQGLKVGRDGLFTLLRKEGMLIRAKRSFTKTTNSRHWMRKYPNRIKDTPVHRPEQVWVADITYVRTRQGFSYLHLLTDAYSKQIMGYQLSNSMSAEDTAKALKMALAKRRYPAGPLVHHSDRGLQYCSELYTGLLRQAGIAISMTEQADPYENAVAERVNGILKDEFGLGDCFEDISDVQQQIHQAIQGYNNLRPHLSNHMLTPVQMHGQSQLPIKKYNKKAQVNLSLPVPHLVT
jgi:putative transposase